MTKYVKEQTNIIQINKQLSREDKDMQSFINIIEVDKKTNLMV